MRIFFAKGSLTGSMLKSTTGWSDGKNGIDAYGFGAKPADGEGKVRFWSSTNVATEFDWFGNIFFEIGTDSAKLKIYEISQYLNLEAPVRCLKNGENQLPPPYTYPSVKCDKPTPYSGEYGSFTDERDGNVYRTVDIDGLVWFVDNLKYEIPDGLTFCNCGDTTSCDGWGRLYPFKEAKVACPAGWRLPLFEEVMHLKELEAQTHYDLGGCVGNGDLLRATEGWKYSQGNDMFGFGAVPAGLKYYSQNESSEVTEEYCNLRPRENGSATSHAAFWFIFRNTLDVMELYGGGDIDLHSASSKGVAYSIRCVKE